MIGGVDVEVYGVACFGQLGMPLYIWTALFVAMLYIRSKCAQ